MTQLEFDNKVLFLADRLITLTNISAKLRVQGDPDYERVENRMRFLTNIVSALTNYDITSEVFTDEELKYTFELGTCAQESMSI